jgi:hypothetical protein
MSAASFIKEIPGMIPPVIDSIYCMNKTHYGEDLMMYQCKVLNSVDGEFQA